MFRNMEEGVINRVKRNLQNVHLQYSCDEILGGSIQIESTVE